MQTVLGMSKVIPSESHGKYTLVDNYSIIILFCSILFHVMGRPLKTLLQAHFNYRNTQDLPLAG